MSIPLAGERPAVKPKDTALHAWLVSLVQARLDELGWRQADLRRASGLSGRLSEAMRGVTAGTLGTWQRILDGAGVSLPAVENLGGRRRTFLAYQRHGGDLQTFLAHTVLSADLSGSELSRRAQLHQDSVSRMLRGTYGGSLVAWQRLLDAAEVSLGPRPA